MMHPDDTIAAVSTPVGPGGIGIVRLSGRESLPIADRVFRSAQQRPSQAKGFTILHGHVVDPATGKALDEALLSVMRCPRSYTREDVVEISCHGGGVAVRQVLGLVLSEGARLAEPGEFTKRAFLNGRISLDQAEAVLDIIQARTSEGMRIAVEQLRGGLSGRLSAIREALIGIAAQTEAHIDFPEEEIVPEALDAILRQVSDAQDEIDALSRTFEEARFFREGLSVAIVGKPNVGKSSLLNRLLSKDRAIVTDLPGTTRDVIEEMLNINGLPVRIMDTAGIRDSHEPVEKEGIRRSLEAIERADLIVAMLDQSRPLTDEDHDLLGLIRGRRALVALNKSDLPGAIGIEDIVPDETVCVPVSAKTGQGIEDLKAALFQESLPGWGEEREGLLVTNLRHKTALDRASQALGRAMTSFRENHPLEIVSIELRDAIENIAVISGAVTTDEILDRIFSQFCIGK